MAHLNSKTNSFKTLGRGSSSTHDVLPTHEVILVHPFKRVSRYSSILENWVWGSVHGNLISRSFSFDGQDMLNEGQRGLEKVSGKLKQRIQQLRREETSPLFQLPILSPDFLPTNATSLRESDKEEPVSSVIFIAHSLGAWVVKDALAYWNSGNLAFDPAGVIFVDTPASYGEAAYSSYFEEISQKLSLKPANSQQLSDAELPLRKHFNQIDDNFLKFKGSQYIQGKINQVEIDVKFQYLGIWLSTPLLPIPEEQGKRVRVSISVVNLLKYGTRRRTAMPKELVQLRLDRILRQQTAQKIGKGVQPFGHEAPNGDQGKESKPETTMTPPPLPGYNLVHNTHSHAPDQNEQTWSDEVSRPASMKSIIRYVRTTGDRSSIFSVPRFQVSGHFDDEIKKLTMLARTCFERGELRNAETLFNRSISLMNHKNLEPSDFHYLQIRTQIAVILLYRGKYSEAKESLDSIKKDMGSLADSDPKSLEVKQDVERWSAMYLLLQGHYKEAAQNFEKVISERSHVDTRSKDVEAPDIQARRDLALAYGYLGEYAQAKRNIDNAKKFLKTEAGVQNAKSYGRSKRKHNEQDLRAISNTEHHSLPNIGAKGYSVIFTSAILDMLWGEYQSALEKSTIALQGMRELLGRKHPRTLQIASLKALLLAYSSKYSEAETLCKATLRVMADELGREHPLALEALGTLVYIFKSQLRLSEARDTAKSLCEITKECLTNDHPQTLRARSLLAAVHLSLGEYNSAEQEIQKAAILSSCNYGDQSPNSLRYRAEWARVVCFRGRVDEAGAMALDVLQKQIQLYSPIPGKGKDALENPADSPKSFSKKHGILNKVLNDINADKRTFKLHPYMLLTLQVLATIELQTAQADTNLAQSILSMIFQRRKKKLGRIHSLTLTSEYELASVVRENGGIQGIEKARAMFHNVWECRSRLFGEAHPETLSAYRELVITYGVSGIWEIGGPRKRDAGIASVPEQQPESTHNTELEGDQFTPSAELTMVQWGNIAQVSQEIFKLQEAQLGPHHPETLKSYLWLFTLQLLLPEKTCNAVTTANDILSRLRQPSLRTERSVEALRMEEKVALIFAEQNHHIRAARILHEILDDIQHLDNTSDEAFHQALNLVKTDVELEIEQWEPEIQQHDTRLRELHADWLSTYNNGDHIAAEEIMCHINKLSEPLLGAKIKWALSLRFDLAKIQWSTGDLVYQQKARKIISDLAALDESLLGLELVNSVRESQSSMAQYSAH